MAPRNGDNLDAVDDFAVLHFNFELILKLTLIELKSLWIFESIP